MNKRDNNYIQKYIKMRIKSIDRFSYLSYAVTFDKLEFCFEFVGLTSIYLVCGSHSMSYHLTTSIITCGCPHSNCEHKKILLDYFESIVTK